ncbi:MAG: trypsin-like peptidase domain-containing protein [Kofleriaceae bacterium]
MVRRGSVRFLVALAATAIFTSPAAADTEPSALQKASVFAKASVVRVIGYWEITYKLGRNELKEYVGGMGSGFFVSADGFVVTNAHVVEDIKLGEAAAKEKAFAALAQKLQKQYGTEIAQMSEDQRITLVRELQASATAVANNNIVLPDGTKLEYTVKAYGKPGEGNDVAVIKVDTKDAPNLALADTDKVQVQDKLLAIGYPGAADMQGTGLLDEKSQLEASINEGAVSAMKRTPAGETLIQTSAAITHGNSGGPAINDRGEVIGLGTFGSKGEVQGFNFLVASSTVMKFIKQAKVDLKPSQTITLWKKGLDEFYAGDLDLAIADFEEVMTMFPTHSEAPRMMKQARALKKEGKGNKPKDKDKDAAAAGTEAGGGGGAGAAVAVIIVLLVIAGVVVLVIKSKKKPGGAQPQHPGMHPQGMQHGMHPGQPPPGMAPQGYAPPNQQSQPMMMAGRVGPAPISKTVAVGQPQQHAPVAATAFGSLTMGSLTCTRGLLNGQRFSLGHQGLLIGRQPGLAQIVVNDSRASGKHVWIGFENGVLVAIDQGTTNGTFVNDVRNGRISKVPLRDGDTVIVSEPDCLSLTLKLS